MNEQAQIGQLPYQMMDVSETLPPENVCTVFQLLNFRHQTVSLCPPASRTSLARNNSALLRGRVATCRQVPFRDWGCINHGAGGLSAMMTLIINTADRWPSPRASSSALPRRTRALRAPAAFHTRGESLSWQTENSSIICCTKL